LAFKVGSGTIRLSSGRPTGKPGARNSAGPRSGFPGLGTRKGPQKKSSGNFREKSLESLRRGDTDPVRFCHPIPINPRSSVGRRSYQPKDVTVRPRNGKGQESVLDIIGTFWYSTGQPGYRRRINWVPFQKLFHSGNY